MEVSSSFSVWIYYWQWGVWVWIYQMHYGNAFLYANLIVHRSPTIMLVWIVFYLRPPSCQSKKSRDWQACEEHTCSRTHQYVYYEKFQGKVIYLFTLSPPLRHFIRGWDMWKTRVENFGSWRKKRFSLSIWFIYVRGFQRAAEFRPEQWPFILKRVNGAQTLGSVGSN